MRIASLIPSGTDIACALDLQSSLVGVSHCCDNPQTAHLPILTRSIIDSSKAPAQIDAQVAGALENGESLYQTNRELLCELAPDIVLTQSICDVCAVNSALAARDLPPNAKLVNLSATSFGGLWDDLRRVASATGTDAETLIHGLQTRLCAVENAVKNQPKPRVLVLEWSDPPFLGGHWVPEMTAIAGGVHVLSAPGEPSRRAEWQEIEAAQPEIVILAPCGYDLPQVVEQGRALLGGPLADIDARQIWASDASALFSRCTPATVAGVEALASVLHPGAGISQTRGAFELLRGTPYGTP